MRYQTRSCTTALLTTTSLFPIPADGSLVPGNEIGFWQDKRSCRQLLRIFPDLSIEGGIIMRIKPALVRQRITGAVMEVRSDTQRA